MRIGIIETGRPPGDLAERFGTYPAMFRRLLGPGFDYADIDATGPLPFPEAHDAFLITGSPAGVYDGLPWIAPLIQWIREARRRTKLVGICFGHQIMAEALGGHVEKSSKGWGVGLHEYPIVARPSWLSGDNIVAAPASHQDQVVIQPPRTELVASSVFTPYAALGWTDQPAISFQFHPEFAPDYAKALIAARRDRLPDPDAAIASLDRPGDGERVAGWIRAFLER